MKNSNSTKQERFEQLLDDYAIALHLTYKILDSGLIERKIKIGNDVDKITQAVNGLMPFIANELRRAKKIKFGIKLSDDIYAGSMVDVANAYFYELNYYGSEWENADLEELFTRYRIQAEKARNDDEE